jgi:hypothetical protein
MTFWSDFAGGLAGTLVAGGVGTVVLKQLLEPLIRHQFDIALEDHKQTNAREIEAVRADIGRLSDVLGRRNQKEFEIVHEAWQRATRAVGFTQQAAMRMETNMPDFHNLDEDRAFAVIEASPFHEVNKIRLRKAAPQERWDLYAEFLFWWRLSEARSAVNEFSNYVNANRIFLVVDIRDRMLTVAQELGSAIVSVEIGYAADFKMVAEGAEQARKTSTMLDELEAAIQRRFHLLDES